VVLGFADECGNGFSTVCAAEFVEHGPNGRLRGGAGSYTPESLNELGTESAVI
jgi:hypothetical protein